MSSTMRQDAPPQARLWNIANVLTLARIALVPFFGYFLVAEHGENTSFRVTAWVLFAVAAITDRIDGQLARSRNLVTDFGKLMDPIADKALMGMAFIGLSVIDLVPWWVTVVIVVRELSITALRFVVLRHGVIAASRGGKLKTMLQAVAAGLFVLPLPQWGRVAAWIVLVAAVIVTVVTAVDYVLAAMRLRRASGEAA